MAVGDDATQAGFPLVPDTGQGGEVRLGALELNRTRDFIAQVKSTIPSTQPVTKGGTGATNGGQAKINLGISSGTSDPSDSVGGSIDGNIYFKIVGG